MDMPGHKYTDPYNDLENQVRYDPTTGEILEIYDPPTGRTDGINPLNPNIKIEILICYLYTFSIEVVGIIC